MYLIYFSNTYNDFRLPELNSLLELFGYDVNTVYNMYILHFIFYKIEMIIKKNLLLCWRRFLMMSVFVRYILMKINIILGMLSFYLNKSSISIMV